MLSLYLRKNQVKMMKKKRRIWPPDDRELHYRSVPKHMLSDIVAGRVQAGHPPAPPKNETELDRWQDEDWFHSPEL